MKIKELYTFTVPKKIKVIEKEESINESGAKVTIEKEIERLDDVSFCIRKPNARSINDAQLFYNVQVGRGLQEGLISAALLFKRLKNDGGSLPELDKEEYGNLIVEYFQLDEEYKKLQILPESERSIEQNERLLVLVKKIKLAEKNLQDIQIREENIYNITAESWARSKTILWWMLALLCEKNKDKEWTLMFNGSTFKERDDQYCELQDQELNDEDSDFIGKVLSHAQKAVVAWYYYRETDDDIKLSWQDKISKALGRIESAVLADTEKEISKIKLKEE